MSYLDVLNRELYNTSEYYKNMIDKNIAENKYLYLDLPKDTYLITFHQEEERDKIIIHLMVRGEGKAYKINKRSGVYVFPIV